jgi:hypothetical protein
MLSLEELDEHGHECVTLMASTGKTMLRLVDDLLDADSAELGGSMWGTPSSSHLPEATTSYASKVWMVTSRLSSPTAAFPPPPRLRKIWP